jgi:hypothetical protein
MLVKLCWGILALVHVVPAMAFFKPSLLSSLYGVEAGSIAYVLLHHRASLFLGVFLGCVWAFLYPESRQLAVLVVGISMISFLGLFAMAGMPEGLRLIAIVDLIGIPFLLIATWLAFQKLST